MKKLDLLKCILIGSAVGAISGFIIRNMDMKEKSDDVADDTEEESISEGVTKDIEEDFDSIL